MNEENKTWNFEYSKIGFKSGIEIHQQLDTGKLFCNCAGILRSEKPDFVISRKLHAVAGESGEIDSAVKHESSLNKEFYYQGYNDSNCLIEIDEEPPKMINEQALDEVLKIALLLNCEIYPITQVMRKTVIDGSNTSGFQRTALIAHDGYIETSFGKVKVDSLAIEEDSARTIERSENKVIYRLDRLGIPLVEIATAPEIYNPEQVEEAALKIGEILRACKVKRGIGTIRQDINMSIKNRRRVEIKGFQDPLMMVETVNREINRQLSLIEINDRLKSVKELPEKFKDITKIFQSTYCKIIKEQIDKNGVVLAAKIPECKGLLGKEIAPSKRYGSELALRAKLHGISGLINSDEDMEKYQIFENEINSLKKELGMKENDAFIIIASEKNKAEKAMNAVLERAKEQYSRDVLAEVRGALPDGNTEFQRPLPGRARMYPETDLPLIYIKREKINQIKKQLPKLKGEIKQDLKNKGLSDELVNLVMNEYFDEFITLSKVYPKDVNLVAKMVTLWRNEFASKLNKKIDEIKNILTEKVLEEVLENVNSKKIESGDVRPVLLKILNGAKVEEAIKIDKVSDDKLEEEIMRIIKENPGLRAGGYMGLIIKKIGNDVDKREAMEILNKIVK